MRMILSRIETRLFLAIWLAYTVFVTPAGGTLPNRYVDLVQSIVNERRFEIDTFHENTTDKAYYDGHYYNGALPGPSFFAVPAYLVFKAVYIALPDQFKALASGVQSFKKVQLSDSSFYGRVDNVEFFLSQLFLTVTTVAAISAFGSLLLYRTLRLLAVGEAATLWGTLLYAFGTIAFFYSTTFAGHIFSSTFGIASFYLILLSRKHINSARLAVLAGVISGAGLLVEYSNILMIGIFGLWLALRASKQQVIGYVLGILPSILVLMLYNLVVFDNPFATSYSYLSENERFHLPGFFGLTYPLPERFFSLLVAPETGLFIFCPITIIGLWGILDQAFRPVSGRETSLVAFGVFSAYTIFYSAYSISSGGAVFGPRFLVPVLPFMSIGVALAVDRVPRYLIALFGSVSIFINWLGAQFGFAESIFQPFQVLWSQGPTLPALGAILSHSSNQTSPLYLFASRFHVLITLVVTAGLIALIYYVGRDVWRKAVSVQRA